MKKYIRLLGIMLLLTCFWAGGKSASAKTISYHFDNIPDRTITYTGEDNFLYITIDNTTYIITTKNKIDISRCDENGTIWINILGTNDLFWINYEIQKDYMNTIFYSQGIININSLDDFTYSFSSHLVKLDYPSIEYLQLIYPTLDKPENPTPTIDPSEIPTATPVPTKAPVKPTSPASTATPDPTEPAATGEPVPMPTIPVPTQLPQPVATSPAQPNTPAPAVATPTEGNDTSATVGKPASVIKKGATVSLVDSEGNVIKSLTLKAGKLTIDGGVTIKNVKAAYFTSKGTIVYLTKTGKVYSINSKNKSKLIKSRVKQVKTRKGFAVKLKLKNGRVVKIRV